MPVPSAISDLSTTPASNSPAGSETPSSIDDYLRTQASFIKQLATSAHIWCGTASGTANALALTPTAAITAYVAGLTFRFKASLSNSGATTIAVSGLVAIDLEISGVACAGGEILAGKWYEITLSSATKAQLSNIGVLSANLTTAFNEKRSTVALTATTSPIWTLGVGKIIDGTGTPTIADFPAAPQAGAQREVHPVVGTIITNAGNIAVQGSANYTFAAGDYMIVTAVTTSTFYISIFRGNGQAVTATPDSTAVKLTGDQSIAGSKTFANSIIAPNAPKAWANINGVGAAVFRSSNGFSSLSDNGTGDYTCNFSVAQPNTDYAVVTGLDVTSSSAVNYGYGVQAPVRLTTSVRLQVQYYNNAAGVDSVMVSVSILGN